VAKLADAYVDLKMRGGGAFSRDLTKTKGETDKAVDRMEKRLARMGGNALMKGLGKGFKLLEKLYGDAIKNVLKENEHTSRFMRASTVAIEETAEAVVNMLGPAIDWISEKLEKFNGGVKGTRKELEEFRKKAKVTKTDIDDVWMKGQEQFAKGEGGLEAKPDAAGGGFLDMARKWSLIPTPEDMGALGHWLMGKGSKRKFVGTPEEKSQLAADRKAGLEQLDRGASLPHAPGQPPSPESARPGYQWWLRAREMEADDPTESGRRRAQEGSDAIRENARERLQEQMKKEQETTNKLLSEIKTKLTARFV